MIFSILMVVAQAPSGAQPVTDPQPVIAAATEESAQLKEPEQRKRKCRTVRDNRTGPLSPARKVCRFVDENEAR